MLHERVVGLVVYEGFQLLDLAGPADVLRAATLLGAKPGYRLVLSSPRGEPVEADCGVRVCVESTLDGLESQGAIDTLLVVGGLRVGEAARDERLCAQLRRLSASARRTASVCTGAHLLAAAGLLDGHRATTHWATCEVLAKSHPLVEVLPDQIFVHDRTRWTSAGVTAATDLALALVDDDHGPELAHSVAGWLVVFARRPGGQAQFSAALGRQSARTPAVVEVQRWLPDHLDEDLSVEALAGRAAMSSRHFARLFRREVGATPGDVVEALRVEAARRLLETTDLTVQAVAQAVGLRHAETLHRSFRRRVGTTPERYRQHFARAT